MIKRTLLSTLILSLFLSTTLPIPTIAKTTQECPVTFECGFLDVPLDYANPQSGKIKIAYARTLANKQKPALFINPGGPGASGLNYLFNYKKFFTSELYSNYNLVAIDTRGSGKSGALRCLTDAQEDKLNSFNPFITSKENYDSYLKASALLYAQCNKKYGSSMEHYNLNNITKDYYSLMRKLGASKFNYLGKSYGSAIAVRFAEIYPESVGFVIADGLVNPDLTLSESITNHSKALVRSYYKFINYTASKKSTLGKTPQEVEKNLALLFTDISKPVARPGSKYKFDQLSLVAGVIATLYQGERGYSSLIDDILKARKGDYQSISRKADALIGRDAEGRYIAMVDYSYIITCQSMVHDSEFFKLDTNDNANQVSFARYLALYLRASYIPCKHFKGGYKVENKFISKVLLLSNLYDPITAHEDALSLKENNQNAILLTNPGSTHTLYALGSPCADREVSNYLKTGKVSTTKCQDKL